MLFSLSADLIDRRLGTSSKAIQRHQVESIAVRLISPRRVWTVIMGMPIVIDPVPETFCWERHL